MRHGARMVAADAMARILHDFAQPLGTAALSVETAILLLKQGKADACLESLYTASRGLDRSLLLTRILKVANGGEPGAWIAYFDPSEVFNALSDDISLPPLAVILADRGFFEATLAGLMLALPANGAHSVVSRRGETRITFKGQGADQEALKFWTRALRKLGISARCRAMDDEFEVTLGLRELCFAEERAA